MATTVTLASTNNGTLSGSTLTLSGAIIGTGSQDRIVAVIALGAGTVTAMTIVVNSSVATGAMGFGIFTITTSDSPTSSARVTASNAAAQFITAAITNETSAKGIAGFVTVTTSAGTVTWTNATASFQNTATNKYACATITTSGSALSVSASNALAQASVFVAATFGSTVPQTAVSQQLNEELTPSGHRVPITILPY